MRRQREFGRFHIVIEVSPKRWQIAEPDFADWKFKLMPEKYDSPNDAERECRLLNGEKPSEVDCVA